MDCCFKLSGCVLPEEESKVDLSQKCKPYSLDEQVCRAYCVRVIDGDTVVLNVQTPGGVYEYHTRLSHLDSPELKSKVPLEKHHAKACKAFVEQLIGGKHCILKCGPFDKFGRLLAEVYLPGKVLQNEIQLDSANETGNLDDLVCVNHLLKESAPFVGYEGKTKVPFQFDLTLSRYHLMYRQVFQSIKST